MSKKNTKIYPVVTLDSRKLEKGRLTLDGRLGPSTEHAHSDTASNINPALSPATPGPGPPAAAHEPHARPPCQGGWSTLPGGRGERPLPSCEFTPGKWGSGHLQAGEGQEGRLGVPLGPGELLLEEAGAPREQLWGSPQWEGEEMVYSPEGTELWSPQGEARADSGSTSVLETRPSNMAVFAATRVCVSNGAHVCSRSIRVSGPILSSQESAQGQR